MTTTEETPRLPFARANALAIAPDYEALRRRAPVSRVLTPAGDPAWLVTSYEEAKEVFYPAYKVQRDRIGSLRGWPPLRRAEFDAEVAHGSLYIGSPETVARKIARAVSTA